MHLNSLRNAHNSKSFTGIYGSGFLFKIGRGGGITKGDFDERKCEGKGEEKRERTLRW